MLLPLLSLQSSKSVRPHRWQPTRLLCPWDSPGKNTGVGCHFLLQCVKSKSESEVAQSRPTLSDPMDCSLPGSPIHGIFQSRVLEWGAIAFSVSMLFSQIIPPSPSPTESKSLFFTSVCLLLSCIWGHHYCVSKFHIYALIYYIGVFLSNLLHSV